MINDKQKAAIISGFAQGFSVTDVAKQAGVTRFTARAWRSRVADGDFSIRGERRGRKPALSCEASLQALELLKSGKFCGSKQVAAELHKMGCTASATPVHRTTVLRHARAASKSRGKRLRVVRGMPRKRLTQDTKAKRVAFCEANKDRDWRRVVFTDRCKFTLDYPGEVVHQVAYVEEGERHEAYRVNHGYVLNFYCALTPAGMIPEWTTAGTSGHKSEFVNKKGQPSKNVTSHEYGVVVAKHFLPLCSEKMLKCRARGWVLQQDNDPTHKAALPASDVWNAAPNHPRVELLMNWPPNSPDLSPIENVWSIVKREVLAKGCTNLAGFRQEVVNALQGLKQETIDNLYASMPGRIAACLANGGDRIKK